MKANEFLHKKDVAYMNRLSTPLDFDQIVLLMEEYAALRIHSVSKSFYCQSEIEGGDKGAKQCIHCKEYYKPLEQ